MATDPTIDAICAYVEGVADPRRFARVVEAATRNGTPVLVVKIGDSEAGAAASLSHTGSLTGSDAAWEGLLAGVGAQRVSDIPDLLGAARAHAALEAAVGALGGLDALCELLVRVSGLAIDPSVSELDFNPVMVSRDDVTVVDALVRTGDVDTETEDDDTR